MAAPLLAMAATPAAAQYAPYGAPPPIAVAPDAYVDEALAFQGARIEARVGYDRAQLDVFGDGSDAYDDGVSYGGEAGFDFALGGPIRLGLYGGIDGASTERCGQVFATDVCVKPRRLINAGGRIGVVVSPRAMLYAKAGYSNGGITVRQTGEDDARLKLEGYHVGGGVEAAVTPTVYGKLEYVYTHFNRSEDDSFTDLDLNRQQINAGVGLRF